MCGSLHEESANAELLGAIGEHTGVSMLTLESSLLDLPLFHAKHFKEQVVRNKVVQAKKILIEAELIVIGSPEYNASVTGAAKNFIDWLSVDIEDGLGRNPFFGKKVAVVSTSSSVVGGIRSAMHMSDIMLCLGANLLPQSLCISTKYCALKEGENLLRIKEFCKTLLLSLG